MIRSLLNLTVIVLISVSITYAQENDPKQVESAIQRRWYIGAECNMPLFYGDLKTFIRDQSPVSLGYGLSGGYKIHRLFGLELSLGYGNSRLTSRQSDAQKLLGTDGMTYFEPSFLYTEKYNKIYSDISYMDAGIHVPFNLNNFFTTKRAEHRLTVLLSPAFYARRYRTEVYSKILQQQLFTTTKKWSFDMGADLLLRCQLSKVVDLQLKSGINYIGKSTFEGVGTTPRNNKNFVWNSGVGLIFKFGKTKKTEPEIIVSEAAPLLPAKIVTDSTRKYDVHEDILRQKDSLITMYKAMVDSLQQKSANVAIKEEVHDTNYNAQCLTFPSIFFKRGSPYVNPALYKKELTLILEILTLNPDAKIIISGYSDHAGNHAINKQMSQARAQAVKDYLIKKGVAPTRLLVENGGEDTLRSGENSYDLLARRVDIRLKTPND